jgi:hypothetical protein
VNDYRKRLLAAGVRNLKEFGYPHVDETNILTDQVYSAFFKSMLDDAKEASADANYQGAVADLLKEIEGK